MSDHNNLRPPSPWNPITDPVTLKILGKLLEEAGELTSALSRCVIQGIEEAEPVTGKVNRQWLLEEAADVGVGLELTLRMLQLTPEENVAYMERVARKREHLQAWHEMAGSPPRAWEWEYYHHDPSSGIHEWRREAGVTAPRPSERVRSIRPLR